MDYQAMVQTLAARLNTNPETNWRVEWIKEDAQIRAAICSDDIESNEILMFQQVGTIYCISIVENELVVLIDPHVLMV